MNQTAIDFILNAPPLAALAFKLTLLLAAAWALHVLLARANPRWRVLLWRAAAAGLLALPLLMAAAPALDLPLLPAAFVDAQPARPDLIPLPAADSPALPPALALPVDVTPPLAPAPPIPLPAPVRWGLWQAAGWGAGALLMALRFLLAQRAMRRLVRQAEPAPEAVQRIFDSTAAGLGVKGVRLRLSEATPSPLLFGLRAPVVLLPARMGGDAFRDDLPAIFAHELSHVCSRDLAWLALVRLAQLLAWPHPLAWGMHTACAAAGERVCDAAAANALADRAAYSRSLARVALALAGRPVGGPALAMALPDVRRRLLALQHDLAARPLSRLAVRLAFLISLLMLATLGALRPVQAQNKVDQETIIDSATPAPPAATPTPPAEPTPLSEPARKLLETRIDLIAMKKATLEALMQKIASRMDLKYAIAPGINTVIPEVITRNTPLRQLLDTVMPPNGLSWSIDAQNVLHIDREEAVVRIYKIKRQDGPRIKALIHSLLTASSGTTLSLGRKISIDKDDLIVRDTRENIKKVEALLIGKQFIQPPPKPQLDIANFSLVPSNASGTTLTQQARAIASRAVEAIKVFLYGQYEGGEVQAAREGRRLWFNPDTLQLTITDTADKLARVTAYLDSLPEFGKREQQSIVQLHYRRGEEIERLLTRALQTANEIVFQLRQGESRQWRNITISLLRVHNPSQPGSQPDPTQGIAELTLGAGHRMQQRSMQVMTSEFFGYYRVTLESVTPNPAGDGSGRARFRIRTVPQDGLTLENDGLSIQHLPDQNALFIRYTDGKRYQDALDLIAHLDRPAADPQAQRMLKALDATTLNGSAPPTPIQEIITLKHQRAENMALLLERALRNTMEGRQEVALECRQGEAAQWRDLNLYLIRVRALRGGQHGRSGGANADSATPPPDTAEFTLDTGNQSQNRSMQVRTSIDIGNYRITLESVQIDSNVPPARSGKARFRLATVHQAASTSAAPSPAPAPLSLQRDGLSIQPVPERSDRLIVRYTNVTLFQDMQDLIAQLDRSSVDPSFYEILWTLGVTSGTAVQPTPPPPAAVGRQAQYIIALHHQPAEKMAQSLNRIMGATHGATPRRITIQPEVSANSLRVTTAGTGLLDFDLNDVTDLVAQLDKPMPTLIAEMTCFREVGVNIGSMLNLAPDARIAIGHAGMEQQIAEQEKAGKIIIFARPRLALNDGEEGHLALGVAASRDQGSGISDGFSLDLMAELAVNKTIIIDQLAWNTFIGGKRSTVNGKKISLGLGQFCLIRDPAYAQNRQWIMLKMATKEYASASAPPTVARPLPGAAATRPDDAATSKTQVVIFLTYGVAEEITKKLQDKFGARPGLSIKPLGELNALIVKYRSSEDLAAIREAAKALDKPTPQISLETAFLETTATTPLDPARELGAVPGGAGVKDAQGRLVPRQLRFIEGEQRQMLAALKKTGRWHIVNGPRVTSVVNMETKFALPIATGNSHPVPQGGFVLKMTPALNEEQNSIHLHNLGVQWIGAQAAGKQESVYRDFEVELKDGQTVLVGDPGFGRRWLLLTAHRVK